MSIDLVSLSDFSKMFSKSKDLCFKQPTNGRWKLKKKKKIGKLILKHLFLAVKGHIEGNKKLEKNKKKSKNRTFLGI